LIKKCKWCGKKQEMAGKREFCPGRKCKNSWIYANRTGKLKNKKKIKEKKNVPSNIRNFPTIVGQLARISSTADKCLRLYIDIPSEIIKLNTAQYLFCNVMVAFIEESEKKEDKKKETSGKDRFFK
jgi:hypothetical protein